MSLTNQVNEQICQQKLKNCCKKAFLSALIHTCASLSFDSTGLRVVINCNQSDYIKTLLTELFNAELPPDPKPTIHQNASQILSQLEIFCSIDGKTAINEGIGRGLINQDCCKKAYLKGAFLGCGQLSVEGGYNLEFITTSKKLSQDIHALLTHFGIKALMGGKNGRFRAYVKGKDGVCDTLAAISAFKSVLEVNSIIAKRDLKRKAIQRANCDIYNVDKSLFASMAQVDAIKQLIKSGRLTDKKLIEVANTRLNNPQASYDELKDLLNVSKSTIKYRLQKIMSLSKTINEELK